KREVERGGGEYEADVAHVLVLAAFAQEFELAQDHVLGRRDPGLSSPDADPAAVLQRPGVEGIARREVDVGLELRRVMNQVECTAGAARDLDQECFLRRDV